MTRKYVSEGMLVLYSDAPAMCSVEDLRMLRATPAWRDRLIGTNIYMVVRRPKLLILEETVRVSDGVLAGEISADFGRGEERIGFRSHLPSSFEVAALSVRTHSRSAVWLRAISGHEVVVPIEALFGSAPSPLKHAVDLEVLYVGQAWGKDGRRIALDRLRSHKTWKRIQVESERDAPHCQLFVLMFRYGDHKRALCSGGDFSLDPVATRDEEHEHMHTIMGAEFPRRSRIALAEAALIRYFAPRYNILCKDTFPSKRHRLLKKALELDFADLAVEVDMSEIGARLISPKMPQTLFSEMHPFVHVAKFPLHAQSDRDSFLHGLT